MRLYDVFSLIFLHYCVLHHADFLTSVLSKLGWVCFGYPLPAIASEEIYRDHADEMKARRLSSVAEALRVVIGENLRKKSAKAYVSTPYSFASWQYQERRGLMPRMLG